ncbi:unnamed protein product [Lasius platythorax]|uniref:Uncharacterized protein n=1 Tax=Lasius platythorax TaxID=488582 RepID=A0AAV2P2U6_9HYME
MLYSREVYRCDIAFASLLARLRVGCVSREPRPRGDASRNRCPRRSSRVEGASAVCDNASLEAANVIINEEHRTPSLTREITANHTRKGNTGCIDCRKRSCA